MEKVGLFLKINPMTKKQLGKEGEKTFPVEKKVAYFLHRLIDHLYPVSLNRNDVGQFHDEIYQLLERDL